MIQKLILGAIIIFSLSQQSIAQEEWTLQQCVEEALENSLEIEKAMLGVNFSDIEVQQAKHNRYPSLTANTSLGTNFGRFVNPITDAFISQSFFSNSVGLNSGVAVFNGFRIANSLKQANKNLEASQYDANQMKRDIALSVANTYLSVLFADESLAIAKSQLAVTEGQLTRTNQLIKAGSLPANNALDVEAQLATNQQALINAENDKTIALLNLKQLMRIDIEKEITVVKPEGTKVLSDIEVLSFNDVYNQAFINQPSMRAAELRKQSADLGLKIAKGGLLPTVSAGAGIQSNYGVILNPPVGSPDQKSYSNQLDENLSYNVGLSVNVPIYDNYRNQLGIQRAKLNVLDTENANAQLENNLRVTVQQAITDAKSAKRKLEASDKSVSAYEAAFENAIKKYELGSINSFEYLTIQNNLTQAQVNALIAKYEYIFSMKVLDFYMGKPITLN